MTLTNGCNGVVCTYSFFVQITHAILRLLIPLSDLPEFIARLHSSGLLSSLSNLPMAATTVGDVMSIYRSLLLFIESILLHRAYFSSS